MYLTFSDFVSLHSQSDLKEPEFSELELKAETDINSLTFNRIVSRGFDSLTDFQRLLIKRAVAMQMIFIHDNQDLLDSPLRSYSISGVSMSFDRSKIVDCDGVMTTKQVYNCLMQTGLCYRGII